MGTRGRKSAASLSVVAGTIDGRAAPPKHLTKRQQEIWKAVVASESSEVFRGEARLHLLVEYCRHIEAAEVLAGQIETFDPEWLAEEDGLDRYDRLLRMRDRETKAIGDKATKLRLTNQSRYTPQAAATASKRAGGERKPWEKAG